MDTNNLTLKAHSILAIADRIDRAHNTKRQILILVLFFCIISMCGCVHVTSSVKSRFDDVHPVWLEKKPPLKSMTAPKGFKITPFEAFEIVKQKPWSLSLKHVWHIYADSRYYYVHDAFLGSNSSLAKRQGVKIDGQTGEILNRN